MEATITNTAVITANVVTPITVREIINAEEQSLLTITKSVSPVPVTENGTLTYTFVIQNLGNTAATEETGVVITDTFNPVLKNLTATFNGTAWTEGADYTYDEITGQCGGQDHRTRSDLHAGYHHGSLGNQPRCQHASDLRNRIAPGGSK